MASFPFAGPSGSTWPGQGARPLWPAIVGIWALIMALLLVMFAPDLAGLHMNDPDDALRLVQVRDFLGGQSWFDTHQYRVMAPEGVLMHWSRLVDLPIAATIVVLRPLLGPTLAEAVALVVVPGATLFCALGLVMTTARRLFDRETAIVAGIVTGLIGPLVHQMQPLRIDHHGWQIVAALGAMAALHGRHDRKSAWVMGLSLAAGLTISLEGLPLAGLFLGAMALRSLRTGRWDLVFQVALALALGTLSFFLAFRGLTDLVEHCDAVSPMHLAALGWVAAGTLGLVFWRPRSPIVALVALGAIAGVAGAIIAMAAPQCAGGAFGGMDPFVKHYWLDNIPEGLPIWTAKIYSIVTLISVTPLGLWGCWQLSRSAPTNGRMVNQGKVNQGMANQRMDWVEHGLVLLGALLIGSLVSRAMVTAAALAIVPASWLLRRWRLAAIAQPTAARRMAINLGLMFAVLPVVPVVLVLSAWSEATGRPVNRTENAMGRLSGCDFTRGLPALNGLPATDIFAPVDIGPELLMRTHQRVVATGHHRAEAAIGDVMHAFMADPVAAQDYVRRRHAKLIVVCTVAPEMGIYRGTSPHGLAAALLADRPPAWLKPLPLTVAPAPPALWSSARKERDKPTNIKAWQVITP